MLLCHLLIVFVLFLLICVIIAALSAVVMCLFFIHVIAPQLTTLTIVLSVVSLLLSLRFEDGGNLCFLLVL